MEGPSEFIKVRRQLDRGWSFRSMYKGLGATMLRNSFLFSSFVVYLDFSKQVVPGGLGPFWSGAVCANLAWLTVWPMDVVKSQMQSGLYEGRGIGPLLKDVWRSGKLYRGLLPGLTRSTIANGMGMWVYKKVEAALNENSSV